MLVRRTAIEDLVIIEMKHIPDDRGAVREFFRASDWDENMPEVGAWRQVNVTTTKRGIVRGLHGEDMTKLVGIAAGSAFGAYVDARPTSPSFGEVVTVELVLGRQVLVPSGVCNGFQTTSEDSVYVYCFDEEWQPGMPGVAVSAIDPALGIKWPIPVDADVHLSQKDRELPPFSALREG
jgi:dTDP-4-dehydrorhamnose 3,5-epimerase